MKRDDLSSLLQEWDTVPAPCPTMAEQVLERVRSQRLQSRLSLWPAAPAARLRFAAACLLLGIGAGAAYAEWVTLRNEDLLRSEMTGHYLHTINPKYQGPAGGLPS